MRTFAGTTMMRRHVAQFSTNDLAIHVFRERVARVDGRNVFSIHRSPDTFAQVDGLRACDLSYDIDDDTLARELHALLIKLRD